MRRPLLVLVLLGPLAAGRIGAAADAVKPVPAAQAPDTAYLAFLKAVHTAESTSAIEPYLTDEALAQLKPLPQRARLQALQAVAVPLEGLEDLKVVHQKVSGDTAALDVEARIRPFRDPTTVVGKVEMVRLARGWVVRSETWTHDGQPYWSGLAAPGVFPGEAVKVDPLRWATQDTMTVISGEAAYQASNQGYYDTLVCLGQPSGCLPGFPAGGQAFLTAELASLVTKDGYRRRFDPGAPAVKAPAASRSSLQSYAYWLIPEPPAAGKVARCGDSTGIICDMPNATAPPTRGECPVQNGCVPVH